MIDYVDDLQAHLRVESDKKTVFRSSEEKLAVSKFLEVVNELSIEFGHPGDFPIEAIEEGRGKELRQAAYLALLEFMKNGIGSYKTGRTIDAATPIQDMVSRRRRPKDNDRWKLYWILNRARGLEGDLPLLDGNCQLPDLPAMLSIWFAEGSDETPFDSLVEKELIMNFSNSLSEATKVSKGPQTLGELALSDFGREILVNAALACREIEQGGIGQFDVLGC